MRKAHERASRTSRVSLHASAVEIPEESSVGASSTRSAPTTRQFRQITPTNGDYTLKRVADPYEYIRETLAEDAPRLQKQLGTDEQWASLIPFAAPGGTMAEIIPRVLNLRVFDPRPVIANWAALSANEKWAFYLWYRLELDRAGDYAAFAAERSAASRDLPGGVECAILDGLDRPDLDDWVRQRAELLERAGYRAPSREFLEKLDRVPDLQTKLKLLTGQTHEERTKILELVSQALREERPMTDLQPLLEERYPDLLRYLRPPAHLSGELRTYMEAYKRSKIADCFSRELSDMAGQIDCLAFRTRGSLLYSLKGAAQPPYFLWFDGLGIEWIDLLLEKMKGMDPTVTLLKAEIGTAVLPTVTAANMAKADPETISEKKMDDMDTLSHIRDRSDCNYCSIVAKQFELVGTIARRILETIREHPDREVVVTADHGMSRMAAKGFHLTQGVTPPPKAEVLERGRYCILPAGAPSPNLSNTRIDGNIVAFCTHNHFTSPGYAPGEVHGGASPEEWLVPILRFAKAGQKNTAAKHIAYRLAASDVFLGADGAAVLTVNTEEAAERLVAEVQGARFRGASADGRTWTIRIPGLTAGDRYSVRIYPNGLFTEKEETVFVKRRGLTVDDDLF